MALQESGEMYLETILILSQNSSFVRAIDVGAHMGYSKPSVSRALGLLKADNYITVDTDGSIHLTESGKALAEKIYERHRVLSTCLESIGVSPQTASDDACRIEHIISDETFNALKAHLKKHNNQNEIALTQHAKQNNKQK